MALVGSDKNTQAASTETRKAVSGLSLPPLRRTGTMVAEKATILLYAQARWGKTRVFKTVDGVGLIISCEIGRTGGLLTLQDVDMPYITIDSDKHMALVLGELGKRADGVVDYQGEKIDWIILDSLSALGEMWYERGKDVLGVPAGELASTSKVDGRQIYGYVAERGRQQFKQLMNLNVHLLVVAREGVQEEGTDPKTKIQFVAPEIPGQKLPRELPGWPDATLHGVIVNGKRLMRTRTVAKAVAGIRLPDSLKGQPITMPELILPNMAEVKNLMLGDPTAIERLSPRKDEEKSPSTRR